MSGVFKAVGKVFKTVAKAVKKVVKAVVKIAKPLLIAAAIYFTAGLAIGAFGGASVISSLPGWGAGGIFSSAAGSIGGWTGFAAGGELAGAAAGAAVAGGVEGATAAASGSIASSVASGQGLVNSVIPGAVGGATGGAAGSGGIIGGLVNYAKSPGGGYVLAKGVSGLAKYQAEKEQRKYDESVSQRHGIFGMDQIGNQINLPTQGTSPPAALQAPAINAPQVPAGQQQNQANANGNIAVLTPSQLLDLQRKSYIMNPTG